MKQNTHFKYLQNVSLRGSLAMDYLRLANSAPEELEDFVFKMATSNNPSIIKINSGGEILVGKAEDRGKYFPDW